MCSSDSGDVSGANVSTSDPPVARDLTFSTATGSTTIPAAAVSTLPDDFHLVRGFATNAVAMT